jgi:transcriptional regulator with XRE-family HTH domain
MKTSRFGAYLKQLRISTGLTLRAFCLKKGFDPGNYSRLERGLLPPPRSEEKLKEYARALGLKPGSDEWLEFFDRAAAVRGQLPKDLLTDEEVVEKLPLLFRTLRGAPVASDKLDELVEKIRRS